MHISTNCFFQQLKDSVIRMIVRHDFHSTREVGGEIENGHGFGLAFQEEYVREQ